MSSAEKAEAVFRTLLKELGVNVTEQQGEGVLAFKSEEYKFTLNVHRGEDGNFDKAVVVKFSEAEESCKRFDAVVDALSELFKAMSCEQPKDKEKSEETGEETGEEKCEEKPDADAKEEKKKDDGEEATEGQGQAEEKPTEPEA